MLMADRQKVIDIALAEVGYLEKASNSSLDDRTANAGSNNYTKYARDLDNVTGFYNGHKQGYAWCDVFVDWCFVQAFGVETAKALLCQPNFSAGAGCQYSAQYYRQRGQFYTSKPQPGDQIFFGNQANCYHTGLVIKVDAARVYTVEGNTSGGSSVVANGGGVFEKSYALSNSNIYGYGRPKYDTATVSKAQTETTPKPITTPVSTVNTGKVNTCQTTLKELSKGMKGVQVVVMQSALIHYGFRVGADGADGDFGSNSEIALKRFQTANGLSPDGICGKKTWEALLN